MVVTTYGSVVDTTVTSAAGIDPEIETADAAPLVDDLYDADQTYYLKNGHHNGRWTAQRIWNLLLPLIVAGLLIGGAATYLLRDFNNLYPGQGNGGSTADTSRSIIPKNNGGDSQSYAATTGSSSTTHSSSISSKQHHTTFHPPNDDIGASCSLHPDCSMLIGNCCPTAEGKTLECCSI